MKIDTYIHGLKCDNPNCDYVNSNIPFEQYEQFIDYPCPKCGQSLLTIEAYNACVSLKNIGDFISKLTFGAKNNSDMAAILPMEMDKDGHIRPKK